MTTAVANPKRTIRAQRTEPSPKPRQLILSVLRWAGVGIVAAALIWSYGPTILSLMREWKNDENYSVGQLVPFAALYLAWHDRKRLSHCNVRTCWWGLGVLLISQVLRAAGVFYLYESMERYSMILAVWGTTMLLGGSAVVGASKYILLFLVLMIPLPGKVHNMVSGPLQDLATAGAVFFLELFGVTVGREGHVLLLNDRVPIAVAEACSGLRMLTAFIVVDAVLTYLVARPAWQKWIMLGAAVPVAVVCNLLRLVVTALLFLSVDADFAVRFFHDFAGWTMMPLAVGLLLGLLALLSRLSISDKHPLRER